MKFVYIVLDTHDDNHIISVNSTMLGARTALLNFLTNIPDYSDVDWEEFANEAGFDSVAEYQEAIMLSDDYDAEMMVKVEVKEVQE